MYRENELIRQTSLDGAFFLGERTFMKPRLVFLAAKKAFLRGDRNFLRNKDDPLRRGLVEVAAATLPRALAKRIVAQSCVKITKRTLNASNMQKVVKNAVTAVFCEELSYDEDKVAARAHVERLAEELERVWVQVDRAAFASVLPAKPLEGLKSWYR